MVFSARHGFQFFLLPVLLLASLGAGACRRVQVVVPVKDSAALQYKEAMNYRAEKNTEMNYNKKKLARDRECIRQTYQKVVDYFPADRVFTPLAKLDIIIMEAGLDDQRSASKDPLIKVSERQRLQAIENFKNLAKEYPEYEYIQAMCLFQQGQIYKLLSRFEKSQECFKQIMNQFAASKNDKIKLIVTESAFFYNKVYVNAK